MSSLQHQQFCDQCYKETTVVEVGLSDYAGDKTQICKSCLEKALELFNVIGGETMNDPNIDISLFTTGQYGRLWIHRVYNAIDGGVLYIYVLPKDIVVEGDNIHRVHKELVYGPVGIKPSWGGWIHAWKAEGKWQDDFYALLAERKVAKKAENKGRFDKDFKEAEEAKDRRAKLLESY